MALEVVGAPGETKLTTKEAAKRRLGLNEMSKEHDELLDQLIRQASDEVVSYCGRPFARQHVRETGLKDSYGGTLMVTLTPLVTIHSITIDGETILGYEMEEADAGFIGGVSGGVLGAGERLWWNDPFTPSTARRIVVEYTGGFVVPGQTGRNLPYDLEAAVLEIVANNFQAQGEGEAAPIRQLHVDDITVQYESGGASALPTILDRLERWRRAA